MMFWIQMRMAYSLQTLIRFSSVCRINRDSMKITLPQSNAVKFTYHLIINLLYGTDTETWGTRKCNPFMCNLWCTVMGENEITKWGTRWRKQLLRLIVWLLYYRPPTFKIFHSSFGIHFSRLASYPTAYSMLVHTKTWLVVT